jgi:predicted RNA-binding Zn-ribbon protein involved in translation (DUF1610 family)
VSSRAADPAHPIADDEVVTYHLQEPRRPSSAESSAAEEAEATQPCPSCGERIAQSAAKCRFCGESLTGSRWRDSAETSAKITVGGVFDEAWNIYKSQMGLCIGAFLLSAFVTFFAGLPANILQSLIEKGGVGQDAMGVVVLLYLLALLFSAAVNIFLSAGFNIMLLKVIRAQRAQVSDIFSAGKFLPRLIGNTFVFTVVYLLGMLALVVPGVLVLLMWWPFGLVLVDQNPAGLEPLRIARRVTAGNRLTSFLLMLAAFGINVLGVIACCIGAVFTIPFTGLMFAVAYDQMIHPERGGA